MHAPQRIVLMACLAAAVIATAGGCRPASEPANPTLVASHDRLLIRQQVTEMLEDMFFEVERPPRDLQRIDTLPLVSAHPTEFWRPDVRTFEDKVESSLHTMRRTVTIFMRDPAQDEASPSTPTAAPSAPANGGLSIEVIVRKERLAVAGAINATSAGDMYSVYSGRIRALEDYEAHYGVGETWVDHGRDAALEQYLLKRILKQIGS
ncbi:MAG TPA: hypothetical protein PLP01_05075 [Phycisphaerae bacterium]|nr:hypothetical protein [Phycisphaerae bacterium]HOI54597.1 hypothetical protein [Phycisphaerae bacterium]